MTHALGENIAFTSNRERRLWLYAAATVLAIYSTIGWSGLLVDFISARRRRSHRTAVAR